MIEFNGPTRGRTQRRIRLGLHLISSLLLFALLLAAKPALAEEPDEAYLPIYSQIQDAESLETSGKTAQALTNYQQAAVSLKAFQRKFPDWNTRVVSARLNRLVEKITTLSQKPATPQPQAGAASGAPSAEGVAKVLDPGAEPRKVLRLHPKAGDKQTLAMALKIGMETKMGAMETPAMQMPPMKITMDVAVKNVSPEGDITYEMTVSDFSVEESGSMAQMAGMMKASMGAFKGMSGTATVSDRGVSKAMEMSLPQGADPQGRQTMDRMKGMLTSSVLALPEEAVGVGAKWEVRKVSNAQGFPVNQTETYELVAVEGDRLTLKNSVTENAANQKIQSPLGKAAAKMELTKMTGTGTGELTADLGQMMPLEATAKQHIETTMAMTMGGPQKQTLGQKMDLEIHLQAK